jgi:galactose mutarotase-like enzyme
MFTNASIANRFLTVSVKQKGAELCSIRSAGGQEYLWQADPAVWPRHAPILFPIVGKLANDRYSHEGRTYELTQHGFARDLDFEQVEASRESVSYRLLPSSLTRQKYPFDFVLAVNYRLKDNRLEIQYVVRNNGRTVMPFSSGAHPGFALNWGKGNRIEDYFLEFEKRETAEPFLLGRNHLLSAETANVLEQGKVLPLRRDLFDRDAFLFLGLKSHKVSLCSRQQRRRLTVEFPGFPDLGVWAKPGASFVCIEPWYGHVDPENSNGILLNKPGIIKLPPGDTFQCAHAIVVEE